MLLKDHLLGREGWCFNFGSLTECFSNFINKSPSSHLRFSRVPLLNYCRSFVICLFYFLNCPIKKKLFLGLFKISTFITQFTFYIISDSSHFD